MIQEEILKKLEQSYLNAIQFAEIVETTKEELAKATMTSGFSTGVKLAGFWTAMKEVINMEDSLYNLSEEDTKRIVNFVSDKTDLSNGVVQTAVVKLTDIFKEFIILVKTIK